MATRPSYEELTQKIDQLSKEIEASKKREKSLEETESYYRAIFDFGPDGVVVLDPESTRIIDFNDQACRQLGYSREEFAHLHLSEIEEKETAEVAKAHIQRILETGFDSFETFHRTKLGAIRYVHVLAKVIEVGGRQIYHCIWRDITERKLAEEKFKIAFNSAPIGIILTDNQGIVVDCNQHFANIFGARCEDYFGMNLLVKIPQGPVRQNLADAIADGKMHKYEGPYTSVITKKRMDLSITTERASEDLFITLIMDITERKRAEDALRESEDKFSLTFKSSPDAVNINRVDDGLYEDINEGFTRITGYTLENIKEQTSLALEIWKDPADRQRLIQGLREKGYVENLEAEFRKKDGGLVTGLMSARLISLRGVPHLISITRDITELKIHQKERLKIEKLESLGILAGGIAHDFNNILTGIMGNISYAKVFLEVAHKSYPPLVEAEKAAVRAGELATQLLTFARGGEPNKKAISPLHIINEALSLVLHGSNVKGSVLIPDSIHAFKADEGQISQVFHNIIINATQAMPGGGMLKISAQNENLSSNNALSLPSGPYICLKFVDQGCGISDEDLKRIFDPYFTTKSAGTGLGLATVYSIINRHGGHIGVSSEIGKGTTFIIYLPSLGVPFSNNQTEVSEQTISENKNGSILVMDDEELIRDIVSSMLTYLGYEVTTCTNGEDAIKLYRASVEAGTPYLTVIMDLTIPGGLGGKQAAEQILSEFPKASLVVSSGYSNDPILSNYQKYGFSGTLAKPFKIVALKKVMDSLPAY